MSLKLAWQSKMLHNKIIMFIMYIVIYYLSNLIICQPALKIEGLLTLNIQS